MILQFQLKISQRFVAISNFRNVPPLVISHNDKIKERDNE